MRLYYIADPVLGGASHGPMADFINIENETDTIKKLKMCLDVAEKEGRVYVNLILKGTAFEEEKTFSDSIIKWLGETFIYTPRALKGKIEPPYQWLKIKSIRNDYIPKIKHLEMFGVSFDKFVCAHCAPGYNYVPDPIQVGGNKDGLTVLYREVKYEKIEKMFSVFGNPIFKI